MHVLFLCLKCVSIGAFFSVFFGFSITAYAADILISGGTIIDIYSGKERVADILIHDDKISFVGSAKNSKLPSNLHKIDAAGKYIIPGLWDMHVHLTFYPELKEHLPALYIANGVTSVRDMGSQLDEVLAFKEYLSKENRVGPHIWLAGPIVDASPRVFDGRSPTQPNISIAANSPDEAIATVNYLAAKGVNLIKPYMELSPDTFFALVKQAKTHHLPVAGHIPNRVSLAEAVAAGMDDIQHLGGHHAKQDCSQLSKVTSAKKNKDSENAKILNEAHADVKASSISCTALIQQYVENGTWHTPTLVNSIGPHALGFYQDPVWTSAFRLLPEPLGLQFEEFQKKYDATFYNSDWSFGITKKMHKAGVKFLAGTDSPPTPNLMPGYGLHFELNALVQAGLSPLEALQAATINPATFFSVESTQGSIEKGKVADLVLLDADPLLNINHTQKINMVIANGKVFDRSELDSLLNFND